MAKKLSPTFIKKIKPIKLLCLDVDGVMTDGRIIYDDNGKETKVFDVKDGRGIKLLIRAGIDVAIITARSPMWCFTVQKSWHKTGISKGYG